MIEDLVKIDANGDHGDSGGPVYFRRDDNADQPNTVRAAGIFVSIDDDGNSHYVRIEDALDWISDESGVSVTLKTWAGAPGCTPLSDCNVDDGGDYNQA